MMYLWRVVFVLYVTAVSSLAFGLYVTRNGMVGMLFAAGLTLLSLPWSAVSVLGSINGTSGNFLMAAMIAGPLINGYLLWRLSWRRAQKATAVMTLAPEVAPATAIVPAQEPTTALAATGEGSRADLQILWWLILTPVCVVLAAGWAASSRSSMMGMELAGTVLGAQAVSLINCAAFFREQLSRQAIIRWSIASVLAGIVLSTLLPLQSLTWYLQMPIHRIPGISAYLVAPYLHPLLWIVLLALLYIAARKKRQRRHRRSDT